MIILRSKWQHWKKIHSHLISIGIQILSSIYCMNRILIIAGRWYKFYRIQIELGGYTQKMYKKAMEVIAVVSNIDTRFTALLSRTVRPDILFTVGPGFPTTCKVRYHKLWSINNLQGRGISSVQTLNCCFLFVIHLLVYTMNSISFIFSGGISLL